MSFPLDRCGTIELCGACRFMSPPAFQHSHSREAITRTIRVTAGYTSIVPIPRPNDVTWRIVVGTAAIITSTATRRFVTVARSRRDDGAGARGASLLEEVLPAMAHLVVVTLGSRAFVSPDVSNGAPSTTT